MKGEFVRKKENKSIKLFFNVEMATHITPEKAKIIQFFKKFSILHNKIVCNYT